MTTADYIKLEVTIVEDGHDMLTTTVEASETYTDLDTVYELLKRRMRETGDLAALRENKPDPSIERMDRRPGGLS